MTVILVNGQEIRCESLYRKADGHYLYTDKMVQIPIHLVKEIIVTDYRKDGDLS